MGVSWRVVEWLREKGHDAVHLREEGLQRLPNGKIFQKAFTEKRVVLTFDLDFGEIMAFSSGCTIGIIIFRLHNTMTPHVIERLSRVLEDASYDIEKGAIVVVEELRHRVRRLPFN
ncbi:hypothetical protein ASN18_2770 [Candidatus Magnetominusculus xianensis]|uniref:DUF5615 domain-containing protein n=2 Tax=Candidatus Magnetominusculus xianensis TaxID=1748249 RepID=A0ABR5SC29_9BACT|nr:hypothetical protein ASN18_2770 [Candidatus Magnetominusculus xianensis]